MRNRDFFIIVMTLFGLSAHAGLGDSPTNSTGSTGGSKGGIKLTNYSASCNKCGETGIGGKDESPGGLKPSEYTLDQPGRSADGKAIVVVAVPQSGGTADLFKKCFKISSGDLESASANAKDVLFYASDRYGEGSNGQNKIDISRQCSDDCSWNKSWEGAAVQEEPCPPMNTAGGGG
jgi:hypothetical protein